MMVSSAPCHSGLSGSGAVSLRLLVVALSSVESLVEAASVVEARPMIGDLTPARAKEGVL